MVKIKLYNNPCSRRWPTPIHILAALSGLGGFKKEHMKLGGKSGVRLGGVGKEGVWGGFNQNTLYTYM